MIGNVSCSVLHPTQRPSNPIQSIPTTYSLHGATPVLDVIFQYLSSINTFANDGYWSTLDISHRVLQTELSRLPLNIYDELQPIGLQNLNECSILIPSKVFFNIATSFIQENSAFVTDHSMMLDVVDYMCIKKQSECLDVMN